MPDDCIFCLIATGRIPATVVGEDERVLAFRDLNPVAPEHLLIIPKEHVSSSLADLEDPSIAGDIAAMARRLAVGPAFEGGWRLVTNVGPDAGQSVFHLHFHLLGGRPFAWPPG
jgi:histidine triad (HIT) family protein